MTDSLITCCDILIKRTDGGFDWREMKATKISMMHLAHVRYSHRQVQYVCTANHLRQLLSIPSKARAKKYCSTTKKGRQKHPKAKKNTSLRSIPPPPRFTTQVLVSYSLHIFRYRS